jgi:hypothetical protein
MKGSSTLSSPVFSSAEGNGGDDGNNRPQCGDGREYDTRLRPEQHGGLALLGTKGRVDSTPSCSGVRSAADGPLRNGDASLSRRW